MPYPGFVVSSILTSLFITTPSFLPLPKIKQQIVVNEDGTMSRIDNWAEMAEIEKANVRRILLKRNELRLKKLRAARDAEIANETASNKLE